LLRVPCHAIEIEISHHINISSATVFTLHEKAFNANAVFLKVPFDYRDFFGQLVALIARRAQAFHGNDFPDLSWTTTGALTRTAPDHFDLSVF
jgi:hypothetical protein